MKNLEFQDYSATVEDQDGDQHESVISAAVIRDEHVYVTDSAGNRTRREVMTPTGARQVQAGDVFVETEKPGVYDYLNAVAWASTGYAEGAEDAPEDEADTEPEVVTDPEPVEPTPAAKKAAAKRSLPNGGNS
jgi:hypothetical protein